MRVIGDDGQQLGIFALGDAINMARNQGVDLVEVAPNATPPVCRLVDFGKYRYEQSKKDKEARKHQHANKVKEIQLSPTIDPHDFSVKFQHAVDFLCDDMKVKVTLRFRGREMAHQDIGFQKIDNFIKALTAFGHPDAQPKLIGKGINVMISPLPRNKRAKNPLHAEHNGEVVPSVPAQPVLNVPRPAPVRPQVNRAESEPRQQGFSNNPFSNLDGERDASANGAP